MSFDPFRITDGFLFTWNIENTNLISEAKIISPVFIASNLENSEWNMEFYGQQLKLIRIDSKRRNEVSEINVDLSVASSNGYSCSFMDSKYDQGFHWNVPYNLRNCKILTIHCHIWKANEKIISLIKFSIVTKIKAECRIGIWKVKCFKLLKEDTPTNYVLESAAKQLPSIVFSGEKSTSNPFIDKFFPKLRPEMDLKKSGKTQLFPITPSGKYFRIKVSVNDFSTYKRIFMHGRISVLTKDGKIKCSQNRNFFFRYLSLFETFSSSHHCCNHEMNSEIFFEGDDIDLIEGSLSLICDFIISNCDGKHEVIESNFLPKEYEFLTNSQPSNISAVEKNDFGVQNISKADTGQSIHDLKSTQNFHQPAKTLKKDLNYEYLDKKYCDVILSTENKSFPVHKCILCLKSPVFKTMFETDMKETINKKVCIDDLDSETLRSFLLFLYTNNLENFHWEIATKLYYAADKYQVTSLKSECSSFLKSYLSMSNVCEVMRLADLHQDDDLKLACNEFILKQNAAKIFSSDEWKAFMVSNPALSGEMFQKYFLTKK